MPSPRRRKPEKNPASLFAALGDETRLSVVARLCRAGPMSIAALTETSNVTRQAIAKHLRVMERAGLVGCTRRGRESIWRLNQTRFAEAQRHLTQISRQWDDALERLRASLEPDDSGHRG